MSAFELLCQLLACHPNAAEPPPWIAHGAPDPAAIEAVFLLASQEQIIPSLHESIGSFNDFIPRPYRVMAAVQYEANRKHNRLIAAALHEMDEGFTAAGLKAAVLKGAAWVIEDQAGSAPWRRMEDIDIAVEGHHLAAAMQVMKKLGFQSYLGPDDTAARAEHSFQFPFYRDDLPFLIEVHRDLGWRRDLLPVAQLLSSASSAERGLILPPPWCRAFHAMIHWQIQDQGFSRHLLRMKDMLEVSRFLRRPDVDWEALSDQAKAAGTNDVCDVALVCCAQLLNASLPIPVPTEPNARRWLNRALVVQRSSEDTWRATQIWRMSTLWHCDKLAYRLAQEGEGSLQIKIAVWIGRTVRLPLLGIRAAAFAIHCLVRACMRMKFQKPAI